jgi:RNA polymerase sigma factor (TIGR02999 family)
VVRTQDGSDVTLLLREASSGKREAFDELVPLVYEQLRRLAHQRLLAQRPDHTLNTTALVHEAYLRLVDVERARWQDRAHFFAAAGTVMRNLLVDYARARNAYKRGGGRVKVELDEGALRLSEEYAGAIEDLDDALSRLAELSPRQSQLLEQRYFGGLKLKECAEVLGVSLTTVKNELQLARAWLARELTALDHEF